MATGEWRPARGGRLADDLTAGALEGVTAATEHLLGVSSQLAPIEEGPLSRSGTASQQVNGDRVEGAVSFDTVYAVIQHERMDFQHDPGRIPKYLEVPMNSERDVMSRLIAQAIRKRLG